jgi:hypothetical protein
MVLWANSGRAFLEDEYRDEPESGEEFVEPLRRWVLSKLGGEATEAEQARHALPLGDWITQEVVDDSWDREGGHMLAWALGLTAPPPWDEMLAWGEFAEEFFGFPEPDAWGNDLRLRSIEEIEELAKGYETRYWRIRCSMDDNPEYVFKLLGRAAQLGHVELASDGDLLTTGGESLGAVDLGRFEKISSVVLERLKGLNWLCGQEAGWDDIRENTIVGWLWDEHWEWPGAPF